MSAMVDKEAILDVTAPTAPRSSQGAAAPEDASARAPANAEGRIRRVGFLGAGYIAEYHGKALRALAEAKAVAVCDRSLSRARACGAMFGIPNVYGSLETMLQEQPLDAVHVLLPPDAHFDGAMAVIERGVHVFLEKPMCVRAEQCEALLSHAARKGVRLGVGHNFLFTDSYEHLRNDLGAGTLGPIDHVAIVWNKELGQLVGGPYDTWMLREPANIALEIGSHGVAHMLDLVGTPDALRARASNPVELPTGQTFYRRWQIDGDKGKTAVSIHMSFVPGFSEHFIHVRGGLASATVDFERNTYVLHSHRPYEIDFDRFAMLRSEAKAMQSQALRTLGDYMLSKVRTSSRGNPYGHSIAKAAEAFYQSIGGPVDRRISAELGRDVIATCIEIGRLAGVAPRSGSPISAGSSPNGGGASEATVHAGEATVHAGAGSKPTILVLGATGFIGRELVRQIVASGRSVRVLVRSASKLPPDLRTSQVEVVKGDAASAEDLDKSLTGIEQVLHLARANVKTWADYQRHEIEATRLIAERALAAGVRRFIYTGTIDSYYAGVHAGRITEETPLDPHVDRRNLYARAKAESERVLSEMHRERHLPLVIFRPGIVIGRGGSPFHWGVGMWRNNAICHIWGEGRNKLPLVLVEDVARGLIAGIDAPEDVVGQSFNLVADPVLTANEYLDELERCARIRVQRYPTTIASLYGTAMFKWAVKVLVHHPERIMPSYRDWESRTQRAVFDCSKAKGVLHWQPVSERQELIERGIVIPTKEWLT